MDTNDTSTPTRDDFAGSAFISWDELNGAMTTTFGLLVLVSGAFAAFYELMH